ncbi:FeoB-associated Cys-rich membrane protein [Tepidibacter formicigenes]|jgi:cbb3-type cytochrome oxidase subunit 3|uniref:Virus attachment protein p12 family protein n=1 Tax=Tepidibacter formicigenes DSM 15518 TaxID=1123349 RepID=A0A1M6S578_9FIRM|nr:FeoB-associated Cys-rich membrane protein [Tepidibacter formicigenes]SHK39830.1 hypothetical protein SAMN02744037_02256 [Tepidibacter formicigenes DSM 15518]
MGNIVTIIIAGIVIGYGLYALKKSVKKEVQQGACSRCSSTSCSFKKSS